MVSADGYFEGPNHDLSWHHTDDEFEVFAREQLKETGGILFGRRTYEMMASFWPSEEAKKESPAIAELMDTLPKFVFSTTLSEANWGGTRLLKGNMKKETQALKRAAGKDLAVFGSSMLAVSLIQHSLIDEFRIMVNPVLLGKGTPLFAGLKGRLRMKLLRSRKFASGNTLLYYQFLPNIAYEKDNRDGVRDY